MSERITVPVAPDTVTVLGYRWRPDEPAWQGLDFARAELRTKSTLMLFVCGRDAPYDLHLNVPFMHPDDRKWGCDEWLKYRVRPRAEPGKRWRGRIVKSVSIVPAANRPIPWSIEIEYAGRGHKARVEVIEVGDDPR